MQVLHRPDVTRSVSLPGEVVGFGMEVAWANRFALFPACIIGNIPREAGSPTSRQLASLCGVSLGSAFNFLEKTEVFKMNTSPLDDTTSSGDSEDACTDG